MPYVSPTPSVREQRQRARAPHPDVTLGGDRMRRTGHARSTVTEGERLQQIAQLLHRESQHRLPVEEHHGFLHNTITGALSHTPLAPLVAGEQVGINTGRALAESPDARRETLKGLRDLPAGLVAGPIALVAHPGQTLHSEIERVKHTYGPAIEGDWEEYRRRLGEKDSGGAVPVALDATLAFGSASLGLGKAARTGALGSRAERLMNAERPRLRYSGGREGVMEQEVSPFIGRAIKQRARDRSRQRVNARRVEEARLHPQQGRRPLLEPQAGEVVPRGGTELLHSGRTIRLPSRLRTAERLQRKQASREKAQRRIRLLLDQHDTQGLYQDVAGLKIGKRIGNLSKAERPLLRMVYGGLASTRDHATLGHHLRELRTQILERRKVDPRAGKLYDDDLYVKGIRGRHNDNLRDLDNMIEAVDSGKVDLGKLRVAAKSLRREEARIAGDLYHGREFVGEAGRPDLNRAPVPGAVSQAQLRRYEPGAVFLSRKGALPALKSGESAGQFINRVGLRQVVKAMADEGIERPGYFRSELRFGGGRFSDMAIGGSKALADDRRYSGKLFDVGLEDWRPEVLLAGLMRSHKRTANINLIAEQAQKHALIAPPGQAEFDALDALSERGLAREEAKQAAILEREALAHARREQEEFVRRVWVPARHQLERELVDTHAEIGAVNAEHFTPEGAGHQYWAGLVDARNTLEQTATAARNRGDLAGWRKARKDMKAAQGDLEAAHRERELAWSKVYRARAEADRIEDELSSLLTGDPVSGRAAGPDRLLIAHGDREAAQMAVRDARLAERFEEAPLVQKALARAERVEAAYQAELGHASRAVQERAGRIAREAAQERLGRSAFPGEPERTAREWLDDLERAGVDVDRDVGFINFGRVKRAMKEGTGLEGRPLAAEERFGAEGIDQGSKAFLQALDTGMIEGREFGRALETSPDAFVEDRGWRPVPRAVFEEMQSSARPEWAASRMWDIGKGKASRVLLGFGNASWLAFQVGSNAFLSGIFGRVGPLTAIRAQRWWNRLSDTERKSLIPYLGESTHHLDFDRRYLGASVANSRIVNTKRALESTSWWQFARRGNPIDFMFRLDAKQNQWFRRTLLYKQSKARALQRMGENMGDMVGLQDRIVAKLDGRLRPDEMLADYLSDRPTLELHGRKVDELLGDYLTYTNAERRILHRFTMFYGFLRHSTRLVLWTLPTKHPIAAAVLGKLAMLEQDEARDLLGGDLLPWGLGKFYFKGDSGFGRALDVLPLVSIPDDPRVMEIDLARMSPATNALLDVHSASQLSRVFPPYVSWGIGQLVEENMLSGGDWKVRGFNQGLAGPLKPPYFEGYTPADHLRVAVAQLEQIIPPVNYARHVFFTGPQGDDSSLFLGERETGYKDPNVLRSIAAQKRRTASKGAVGRLIDSAFPAFPVVSEDPGIVTRREEMRREGEKFRRRRRGGGRHARGGSDPNSIAEGIRSSSGGQDDPNAIAEGIRSSASGGQDDPNAIAESIRRGR